MLDLTKYKDEEDNLASLALKIFLAVVVLGVLIVNPAIILLGAFILWTVWAMLNIPPAPSNFSEAPNKYADENTYGSNYYQYRIDCKIKGFAQSKKFVYATCVNEASALAKSDPSIERILAIYRV